MRLWYALVIVGLNVLATLPSAWAADATHDIVVESDGTAVIDGIERIGVAPGVDIDNLTWVALDKSGQPVETFRATVHLPTPLEAGQTPAHQLLVINGVRTATSRAVDADTLEFVATGVGPQATVSVVIDFPKGYFALPPSAAASSAIQGLNPLWTWTSILLPLAGLVVLGWMLIARLLDRRIPRGAAQSAPPAALPPALVSILYENKIEPEAIAATLIDLGRRGYLSIFNKGNNFIFAKEREIDLSTPAFQVGMHEVELSPDELELAKQEGLQPFEKILLSKLFVSDRPISSKEDVKVRIGHGMFSKKVAAVYEYLFRAASAAGYFVSDAIRVHRRYLLLGWLLFVIGVIGFAAGAFALPDPKYFLLFWAGLIALAYVITELAPYVPVRTAAGRQTLGQFLAYRSLLASPTPAPAEAGIDEFFAGLPYAWALRAEGQWAKRFEGVVFHRPQWYFTSKDLRSTSELVADLAPLVEFVAQSFASVRQKTLD